ncbi:HupE/UreJ family protein [Marinospirillum sp.]|uniref:HupE/UreJ family protein n=1 Tax=Marinospirillum sp. TaxID=2183934 RepID=UPI0028701E98|nr:HupE/UreJ family protein [Marinospirillum sp.]MDR9468026.1 HupE/UreJ family protein [Marinospirillum sp.]
MQTSTRFLLMTLTLVPGLALAHVGDHLHTPAGFTGGLLHPLGGLDHLLAMLAVGVLAGLQSGHKQLLVPGAFLLALLGGFLLGLTSFALPLLELGIAASVVLLGLLVTTRIQLPMAAMLLLTALFATFHGYAHGVEYTGSALTFGLGFFLASLALHLCGLALTKTLVQPFPLLIRGSGAAIAISGLVMLF